MIDHMGLDVSDLARSRTFYDAALAPLGVAPFLVEAWGVGYAPIRDGRGEQTVKPSFWIAQGERPTAGLHVAFAARSREAVGAFHAAGLAAGGRDNGAPGLRPNYHPGYYAAFVLDPDGVNVEAVFHEAG